MCTLKPCDQQYLVGSQGWLMPGPPVPRMAPPPDTPLPPSMLVLLAPLLNRSWVVIVCMILVRRLSFCVSFLLVATRVSHVSVLRNATLASLSRALTMRSPISSSPWFCSAAWFAGDTGKCDEFALGLESSFPVLFLCRPIYGLSGVCCNDLPLLPRGVHAAGSNYVLMPVLTMVVAEIGIFASSAISWQISCFRV